MKHAQHEQMMVPFNVVNPCIPYLTKGGKVKHFYVGYLMPGQRRSVLLPDGRRLTVERDRPIRGNVATQD